MAKRNKNKFASKGRKSALRVEALEQRQLLAAVSGAGTEVGSDIHHPNGNVYDQVLMTGSSVTVSNDPGQVTRVSFLDLQGDIVQAEFSGAGTLTVTMDSNDFHTGVAPAGYNQAGVKYVQGLASFTIQGEDASSNFAVFSVGSGNAVNQALFDSTHTGGDHWADVQRITIVADPANPNGSTFGAIYAGNAIFEGNAGTVGIAAANVNVQNGVTIGNIDASLSATPTLVFGAASQFSNVNVAGGDLLSHNGTPINNSTGSGNLAPYVFGINFVAGGASDGTIMPAQVLNPAVQFTGKVNSITTLDTTSDINITGLDQAGLDAIFLNRTFTNDVTIHGKLASGFEIDAAAFKGSVTFTDDIAGNVYLQDINNSNQPIAAFGGDVHFMGDFSGHLDAEALKNVTVDGDFSGHIYSEVLAFADSPLPGGIGNVTIMGNDSGTVWSDWNIGNIWIGGDLTGGSTAFTTNNFNHPFGAKYIGNIGTLTVVGDVNHSGRIEEIDGSGRFGDVVLEGNGDLAANVIGQFYDHGLAGGETSVGSITITDDGSADTVSFNGVHLAGSVVGSIGAITVTGGGTAASWFGLGDIKNDSGSIGNVTVSGFSTIVTYGDISAHTSLGDVSFSTLAGTKTHAASITLKGGIFADTISSISLNTGSDYASVTLDHTSDSAIIHAGTSIGNITIDTGTLTVDAGYNDIWSDGTIGDVTFKAAGDLISSGGIIADGNIGNVTFTAGGAMELHGSDYYHGQIVQSYNGGIGDVTFTGGTHLFVTGDVIAYNDIGNVALSSTGDVDNDHGTHLDGALISSEDGSIGDISITSLDTYVESNHGASIHAYDSIGNVTYTAGWSNYLGGNITADKGSIGNLTFTAATAYTDGSGGYEYGNYVSGHISAHTSIGDVTFTAVYDNSLDGTISAATLGDVSFTGGSNYIGDGGQIMATTAHDFTFTGDTYLSGWNQNVGTIDVGSANVITFHDAAKLKGWYDSTHSAAGIIVETSLHGLHFEGDTTLNGLALDARTATIDGTGDANGWALEFTNLTAATNGSSDHVLWTHVTGDAKFVGNTDLSGSTAGSFWIAYDGTSAHDTIGNLTFTGTVTGATGVLDIVASKIGNIDIETGLNQTDKVLVTNLNVFAGNWSSYDVTVAGETLAKDGSNLSDYTIGKITVVDTQHDGFTSTSLFAGDSSFDAVGGVGNVTLTGGGTAAQQTALFATGADTLRITAGVFGTAAHASAGTYGAGFDFDGYGSVGTAVFTNVDAKTAVNQSILWSAAEPVTGDFTSATSFANADTAWKLANAEHTSNFTDGTASIGNVDINARAVDTTSGYTDSVVNATGLRVLAGVNGSTQAATAIDADLTGAIGNIKVHNLSQVLTLKHQNGSNVGTGDDGDAIGTFTINAPGYFIGTSVGHIQDVNVGLTTGNAVVIGNQHGGVAGDADGDEFIVIVV